MDTRTRRDLDLAHFLDTAPEGKDGPASLVDREPGLRPLLGPQPAPSAQVVTEGDVVAKLLASLPSRRQERRFRWLATAVLVLVLMADLAITASLVQSRKDELAQAQAERVQELEAQVQALMDELDGR